MFLATSTTAFAQIPTLTSTNSGPVINDTFISVQCNTTGVGPGASGATAVWNFGTLTASTTLTPNKDTGSVSAAATSPGFSALSSAASLLLSTTFGTSTYATVTPSGVATYYHEDAAKLSQTGVFINAGNSALYTDALDQLHYPFSFDSSFHDTYAGVLSYTSGPSTVTASETGTDTVTGDGYGTLIIPGYPTPTPAATYLNVLRVHTVQTYRDSANLFGTPTVGNYIFESYTWYQPGYHAPLLTISTATGPGVNTSVVSYAAKQLANHEAVNTVSGLDASVKVYPNPASQFVYINYQNTASRKVHTAIFDVLGREVAVIADQASQGNTTVTYNVSGLPKGSYFVRLQAESEVVSRALEVQ